MYPRLSCYVVKNDFELLIHLLLLLQYWDSRLALSIPSLCYDRNETLFLQLGMHCTNRATCPAQDKHFADICLSQL